MGWGVNYSPYQKSFLLTFFLHFWPTFRIGFIRTHTGLNVCCRLSSHSTNAILRWRKKKHILKEKKNEERIWTKKSKKRKIETKSRNTDAISVSLKGFHVPCPKAVEIEKEKVYSLHSSNILKLAYIVDTICVYLPMDFHSAAEPSSEIYMNWICTVADTHTHTTNKQNHDSISIQSHLWKLSSKYKRNMNPIFIYTFFLLVRLSRVYYVIVYGFWKNSFPIQFAHQFLYFVFFFLVPRAENIVVHFKGCKISTFVISSIESVVCAKAKGR